MITAPFVYYHVFPQQYAREIILSLMMIVIIFELLRVWKRWQVIGQRAHEVGHFSTFAWTIVSLGLVLLFTKSIAWAVPIIAVCALVDPLLGELRLHHVKTEWTVVLGILFAVFIWLICAFYYGFSWKIAMIMGPLAVAVEWPNFKWIDDNALMLLVPLAVLYLLQ